MLTFTTPMPYNTRTLPTHLAQTRDRILSPALPIIMVRTIIRKIILLAILMQASQVPPQAAILPAPAATRNKTRTRTVLRNHLQAMTTSNNLAPRNLLLSHQPNLQPLNLTSKVARLGNKHHSSSSDEKWCFLLHFSTESHFYVILAQMMLKFK